MGIFILVVKWNQKILNVFLFTSLHKKLFINVLKKLVNKNMTEFIFITYSKCNSVNYLKLL